MARALHVDLHRLATTVNALLWVLPPAFFLAGWQWSFYLHFLTVASLFLLLVNLVYRHVQHEHAILRNFGLIGQLRYLMESIGPEFRQYWFTGDRDERPFNRLERSNVYRKAKDVESATSFGSLLDFDASEIKLRHSLFPTPVAGRRPFRLTLGEERGVAQPHTLTRPLLISAMSFGALGSHAVRALARGAAGAGISMNTGEGGWPKYHLMEGADLIFQIGTAKFGVRDTEGRLDPALLRAIAAEPQVKMLEIKFSQGAKPGKGGLLPKEKISAEIAELRGIPRDRDAISPPFHAECRDLPSTVAFIAQIQSLVPIPVGIKLCIGRLGAFRDVVQEMIRQDVFPDWITIDGAEGGTGAAPAGFVDHVGMPLFPALHGAVQILRGAGVRDRTKIFAAGKLIDAGRQAIAFALGADACYSARGFMLAIGCIQARECGSNTCPVGITTQDADLQQGLVIADKAQRVTNYVNNTMHELDELTVAMGRSCPSQLTVDDLYVPTGSVLWHQLVHDPQLAGLTSEIAGSDLDATAANVSHAGHAADDRDDTPAPAGSRP